MLLVGPESIMEDPVDEFADFRFQVEGDPQWK